MATTKNRANQPDIMLVNLNIAIEAALRQYLGPNEDNGGKIFVRFDLPDPEEKPDQATVSVFLYDIQEDLQQRHGEARQYSPMTGTLLPGRTHVRCCYLITYWDSEESNSTPSSDADNQSVIVMNQVLNALLNNRELPGIPASYSRVIPPSEHLNSLGNFWQSLGNKPRLSLSYSVTVPIILQPPVVNAPPIKIIEASVEDKSGSAAEFDTIAGPVLWNTLYMQLVAAAPQDEAVRVQLSKVNVVVVTDSVAADKVTVDVTLTGLTTKAMKARIAAETKKWTSSSTEPVAMIGGRGIFVKSVTDELTEIE